MPIAESLPVLSDADQAAALAELAGTRTEVLLGSVVDMAGVSRAKVVPVRRAAAFHVNGMGAAPVWNAFCIDNNIAFTRRLGVVGDLRVRADLTRLRVLGGGYAWTPAEFFGQDGTPVAECARGLLRRAQARAERAGLSVLAGTEHEFVLTEPGGGQAFAGEWQAYGLGMAVADGFLAGVTTALEAAGVPVEQVHAEYSTGQYEISLSPAPPVLAADNAALARLIIGRTARALGRRASFSPLPFAGGVGNGGHLHLSLSGEGGPLLSGGPGPHGLTGDGAAAIAGILAGLPDLLAVFSGSVLSPLRLRPGRWSGAFACWGLENREAAVRLLADTRGNPHGANLELKTGDPSANVYLALAVLIGLALDGIADGATPPPEVTGDPAADPAAVRLPATQDEALDALQSSERARRLLGAEIVSALLAVRRHEQHTYAGAAPDELAERFRFAWS